MQDEKVKYKLAKLAKETGFDEVCYYLTSEELDKEFGEAHYENGKYHMNSKMNITLPSEEGFVTAPTQSLLRKWLLEEYHLHVNMCALGLKKWSFMIEELSIDGTLVKAGDLGIKNYKSYEEALEAGLLKAFKLINI